MREGGKGEGVTKRRTIGGGGGKPRLVVGKTVLDWPAWSRLCHRGGGHGGAASAVSRAADSGLVCQHGRMLVVIGHGRV